MKNKALTLHDFRLDHGKLIIQIKDKSDRLKVLRKLINEHYSHIAESCKEQVQKTYTLTDSEFGN